MSLAAQVIGYGQNTIVNICTGDFISVLLQIRCTGSEGCSSESDGCTLAKEREASDQC